MGKSVDVFVVDFENPGHGLPALATRKRDVDCKSAGKFYQALRSAGLTDATASDYTMIQYERKSGDSCIQVRNACCVGDSCATTLDSPSGTYCGPQAQEVLARLELTTPSERGTPILILEKGLENERSVRCVLETIALNGYTLNLRLGQLLPVAK